jgi:hypothetical protein
LGRSDPPRPGWTCSLVFVAWKIQKKSKLNSEKIWKLWKKSKLNSENQGNRYNYYWLW